MSGGVRYAVGRLRDTPDRSCQRRIARLGHTIEVGLGLARGYLHTLAYFRTDQFRSGFSRRT